MCRGPTYVDPFSRTARQLKPRTKSEPKVGCFSGFFIFGYAWSAEGRRGRESCGRIENSGVVTRRPTDSVLVVDQQPRLPGLRPQ